MNENSNLLTSLLKRDQLFIFLGIFVLIAVSWLYLLNLNSSSQTSDLIMQDMMPQAASWNFNDAFSIFVMWAVMMIAMMLPSAAPMILIFSAVNKKRAEHGNEFVPTWIFLSGYVLVWIGFSILTTSAQWILHYLALLSSQLRVISPLLGGIILVGAGIYQFTKIKNVCLKNCQTPFDFITGNWRYGKKGAFVMGVKHGSYCLGCCWVLMMILFFVGIMNLLWIALISIFIFAEKILLKTKWMSYTSGLILILSGLWIII